MSNFWKPGARDVKEPTKPAKHMFPVASYETRKAVKKNFGPIVWHSCFISVFLVSWWPALFWSLRLSCSKTLISSFQLLQWVHVLPCAPSCPHPLLMVRSWTAALTISCRMCWYKCDYIFHSVTVMDSWTEVTKLLQILTLPPSCVTARMRTCLVYQRNIVPEMLLSHQVVFCKHEMYHIAFSLVSS